MPDEKKPPVPAEEASAVPASGSGSAVPPGARTKALVESWRRFGETSVLLDEDLFAPPDGEDPPSGRPV